MVQGSQTSEDEMKEVNTVGYSRGEDPDVLDVINEFAQAFNKYIMKKTAPRNALRQYLLKRMPKDTQDVIEGKADWLFL